MPSPTSYQRRGVKVFTGTPSAASEWNLTNGAFPPSSKGHFGTVRYSIWHLSTADGTLKAVSLLLWSVFLTPTADRRIHSRWSFLFFPVEGLEFFLLKRFEGRRIERVLHVKPFDEIFFCQPGLHKWNLIVWLIDRCSHFGNPYFGVPRVQLHMPQSADWLRELSLPRVKCIKALKQMHLGHTNKMGSLSNERSWPTFACLLCEQIDEDDWTLSLSLSTIHFLSVFLQKREEKKTISDNSGG